MSNFSITSKKYFISTGYSLVFLKNRWVNNIYFCMNFFHSRKLFVLMLMANATTLNPWLLEPPNGHYYYQV